ncbi:FAD-binding protein [Corticibacter populi]|uniref:FAD-binding protein n=1 Tax=Corticibacter populi TaxID=1550736 RepID=A0A3M6QRD6_9BURK|nr:FAD-dependent monooxygenase [Corticibacter populi]RMX05614.1 FAD-binding protein [Corticibacter populi]RZS31116.1 salicylate hydroxylase [Corticibacter populi]
MTESTLLIAGGGIGGLSAAIAAGERGLPVHLVEQSHAFGEVGAGIQLGPNAWHCLRQWGLETALSEYVAFPGNILARNALTGEHLSCLPLGEPFITHYGAPYTTIHRADLHALLLERASAYPALQVSMATTVTDYEPAADDRPITVHLSRDHDTQTLTAYALIGADGVHSRIRQQLLPDGTVTPTGHLAYRGLIQQSALPQRMRCTDVTTWLGPNLHAVSYPIRGSEWLNIVLIVDAMAAGHTASQDWDQAAPNDTVLDLGQGLCPPLRDLIQAVSSHGRAHDGHPWRAWPLWGRPALTSAQEMAQQQVALLGDAAHPMLPYLAQGAGMSIEDAFQLQQSLGLEALSISERLQHYARQRYARNAKVQRQARRNGRIFHYRGLMRLARDAALRTAGRRLMDSPWLYRPIWA